MKFNKENLQALLIGHNCTADVSPVEMLYSFYIHHSPPEPDTLRSCHETVSHFVAHLSFREQDNILCAVNALCAEQERCALLDGIYLGAQLIRELMPEG